MSTSELEVRRATIGDVSAIASVHVRSWQCAYRGQIADSIIDSFDEKKRARSWGERLQAPEHAIDVAVLHDDVVGFCSLIRSRDPGTGDDTGEIAAIYVDPAHWRVGAGGALLRASIDAAWRTGYQTLTLWVLASNARARQFYEHFGFAPDGETKGQAGAGDSMFELRYRLQLK